MKNLLLIIGIIILLWSCTNETKTAYELVWSDDFEYEGIPDSTKWSFDTKGNEYGWGNHELQYYTEAELKNAIVSDGTLKIIAHKESKGGKAFTSSRLVT